MEMATGDWGSKMRETRNLRRMKSTFYHARARELGIVVGRGLGQSALVPVDILLRSVNEINIRYYNSGVCLVYVG